MWKSWAGNWGIEDLSNTNGSPGDSTVGGWFANGYPGQVSVGSDYQPQTGTPLSTFDSSLQSLQNNHTVITIPLYDSTSGNGTNETFHISEIAAFVITGYQTNGNQSQRYIQGYFKKRSFVMKIARWVAVHWVAVSLKSG